MGAGSSNAVDTRVRIVDILKRAPFMQMMDDKIISELAACFQLVKYGKGTVIKNDPWLFFIVAEGAVDISSLIPTANRKQQLHEVLCQRRVGDYISFAAREQILGRLMDEAASGNKRNTTRRKSSRAVRKNLMGMLDLNRITADTFTGCTVLKLHRDRFLKLRARVGARRSQTSVNHTRRFSDDENAEPKPTGGKPKMQRRNTAMTGTEKFSLLSSIIESDIVNFLFDIPFLEGVEQSRLVTLSNLCSYIFIRKGEILCQEGEIGDKFFICIHGFLQASVESILRHSNTADVAKPDTEGSTQTQTVERKMMALKKIGAGAYFGEISLLFKIPRICSITALSDSLLVYIDRIAFCNFLKIVPEANLVLLEHVRLNFLDTLIKQGCAFLNAMPQLKRQELSFVSDIVEHFADDVVIEANAKHTGFYILLRGEVEVEYMPLQRAGKSFDIPLLEDGNSAVRAVTPRKEVIRIRPGGYFGHEAIILNEPSPISVKCLDHCLIMRLAPDVFYDFFCFGSGGVCRIVHQVLAW